MNVCVASCLPELFHVMPLTLTLPFAATQTFSGSLLAGKSAFDDCLHSPESMSNFEQPKFAGPKILWIGCCVIDLFSVFLLLFH